MNISYIKFHSKLESVAETHHNFKMDETLPLCGKNKNKKLGLSSNTKIHCLNPWQRSKVDTKFRTTRPANFNKMVKHTQRTLPPNRIYRSTSSQPPNFNLLKIQTRIGYTKCKAFTAFLLHLKR
ncbi:hypothetical protein BRARA_C03782 [Brassica rapa]|uniref:Uncharacterized protein n=1 Tax=Brassica campestris TaxID=3711 RepID=A0A398A5D2_BRACM|nr:hypothetical protein BRARA_C03782 [Brassica rapa]